MIVFLYDKCLIPYIEMKTKQKAILCNMSSMFSGLLDMSPLISHVNIRSITTIPPMQFVDSIDFDMYYAGLLQNDPAVHECFLRLILSSYEGKLIILMVGNDYYRNAIMESLIKYIQQAYGHNCWIVESYEDIEFISESGFTPIGLNTISANMDELNSIYLLTKQSLLGNICVEEENSKWKILR